MVLLHTLRCALAALFLAGLALPARALQLGENQAQILARHGAPGAEDRGKKLAMYFWDGWSAQLQFRDDVVQELVYRRAGSLQESEVAGLLHSNGGTARWRETTPTGAATREWLRDDGAVASCAAARPMLMTFQDARWLAAAVAAAPTIVTPAAPAVVSSTPPVFPKLLGTAPQSEPEPQPAVAAAEPALLSAPRLVPKLQAAEVAAEPAAEPTPEIDPAHVPSAATDPVVAEEAPAEAPAMPAADAPRPAWHGLLWLVVIGAAAGGGVYFFKTKAGHAAPGALCVRPSKRETAESVSATMPELDTLRADQFDLLVGEIFRRDGYTVELSAAAAQDDNIDLTLRRDAETILVQCKHWKTSRVTEREVREFYGAMTAGGAPRGIFVTAGSFTRDAREFADGKGIELMDRTALEESAAAMTRAGENFCEIGSWIEDFAAHARIFDPECPICQGTMVIRSHRANRAVVWSCRNHPRCPGRREPRLDLLTLAAGR